MAVTHAGGEAVKPAGRGTVADGLQLERRLFQTETLFEIGRECSRVRTVGEVLQIILSLVMGSFAAVRGIAFLGNAQGRLDGVFSSGLPTDNTVSAEGLAQSYLLARGE